MPIAVRRRISSLRSQWDVLHHRSCSCFAWRSCRADAFADSKFAVWDTPSILWACIGGRLFMYVLRDPVERIWGVREGNFSVSFSWGVWRGMFWAFRVAVSRWFWLCILMR